MVTMVMLVMIMLMKMTMVTPGPQVTRLTEEVHKAKRQAARAEERLQEAQVRLVWCLLLCSMC